MYKTCNKFMQRALHTSGGGFQKPKRGLPKPKRVFHKPERGFHKPESASVRKNTFYEKNNVPITKDELVHFQREGMTIDDFFETLWPVVREFAKNGIWKPLDVLDLLNKYNLTTACWSKWTPRLTWFLLKYLFEKKARPPQRDETQRRPINMSHAEVAGTALPSVRPMLEPNRPVPVAPAVVVPRNSLTRDDVATRLASLGRVVVQ
jgi:hypothetical protein